MKHWLKIPVAIIALAVALAIAAVVALQLPPVQRAICNKVTDSLSEKTGLDIKVGDIHFALFDRVVMENVSISNGEDPVLTCGKASASVSLPSLLSGEVRIKRVNLDGGEIFPANFPKGQKKEDSGDKPFSLPGIKMAADHIILNDFKVVNYNPAGPFIDRNAEPGRIDFNDFSIEGLHLDIKDVKYDGKSASLSLKDISFEEANSGTRLENLAFDASWDSTGAHIRDFTFKDNYSDISIPEADLAFTDFSAFDNFLENVPFRATIDKSLLDLSSLHSFVDKVDFLELKLKVDGTVEGTVSDLRTESLKVWSGSEKTFLNISAHLLGLPDAEHTMASIKIDSSYAYMSDIADIVYQCTGDKKNFDKSSIARLAPGTKLRFEGTLNGFFEDFVVFGAVKSDLGGCNVDLMCRSNGKEAYEVLGGANLRDFDLGRFLQSESLGKVSCEADASGLFAHNSADSHYRLDSIGISQFDFNGYTYRNISANGDFRHGEFEGRVTCADPNLKFILQGILGPSKEGNNLYHAKLSLGHADLHELGFDKRDISTVKLNATADFTQTKDGRLMGIITAKDIECTSTTGTYPMDSISVVSFSSEGRNGLRISSDMLEGRYRGSIPVTSLLPKLEGMALLGKLDNLAAGIKPAAELCTEEFDLSLKALDTRNLLGYLAPDIHIDSGSIVRLSSKGDNSGEASIRSKHLKYKNIVVQGLNTGITFGKDYTRADLTTDTLVVGGITLDGTSLVADCKDNTALLDFDFRDSADSLYAGCLKAMLSFPNQKESNQKMMVHLDKSFVNIGGGRWNIDPASVFFNDRRIAINTFHVENGAQEIRVKGILSDNPEDVCRFSISDLDLSLADKLMSNPLGLKGTLSGNGSVTGVFSSPDIFGDLTIDSLSMAGKMIGKVEAHSNWDDTYHKVNLSATNTLDGKEALTVTGSYFPDSKSIDATVSAKGFGVGFIEPFLTSLATGVSGSLTADAHVSGTLDKPEIMMFGGHLEQFCATLDYTKVPYILDGYVDITKGKVTLRNFTIKDREKGTGTMPLGEITHSNFNDFYINIPINAKDIIGFDTTISDNNTFYGKAYATGSVGIKGPLSGLALNIDVTTRPGTVVNIPIKQASASRASIITFVDSRSKAAQSTLDSLLNLSRGGKKAEKTASAGINVYARVRATDDARLNLEIDSSTGDALHVNGNGLVDISVIDGAFLINGEYAVSKGEYSLPLMGLVTRDFNLNPGSSILFTGDIMQSELNMEASYTPANKVSVSPLLGTGSTTSARKTVHCILGITDKLANPKLNFDIKIDDLDPTIQNLIEPSLNTEEKKMRQFLALILSGSFIPDEQSGIVNNTSVSYFNATEILSTQLNSILQQLGIPVDFGFSYQPTETGYDMFDVAVSTQLWNNRVSVNGSLGNRRFMTSNRDNIVGDVDVEVKLDSAGRTRLRLFSHSADEYSNYLDQTQRNGVGISYKKEFDSLKDLFHKDGKSRKNGAEKVEAEKADVPEKNPGTPVPQEGEEPVTKNDKD